MKKYKNYLLISIFVTVCSFSVPAENGRGSSFFADLAAMGQYPVSVVNYEPMIFHNHVYKKKLYKKSREKSLQNMAVFKNRLTVFYPEKEGSCPLVVIGHGWGDTKKSNASLAQYLASRGYIAVIFSARKWGRPEALIDAFEQSFFLIEKAVQNKNSVLFQKIAAGKIAAIGHSMGGTAALHYTQTNPSVRVVIALHPYNGASEVIEFVGGKNTVLGTGLSHLQSATLIFTGSKDVIAYPEKTFEFCKTISSELPFAFFSVKNAKHQHPVDKYGNPINGSFNSKKHALYRALIYSWLELFLNKNPEPARQLYLDKSQFAVLKEYLYSSNKKKYPPFLFQHVQSDCSTGRKK